MYDVEKVRADFPILSRQVNGKPLVYLDNGASAQKPQVVIDAVTNAYTHEYANVHRGLHYLSNVATEKYEAVRGIVARFLNAASEDEIILNSGTTEAINMVAYAWAAPRMQAGDEIVLSLLEHHANIVPWHFLRERQGVVLKWVEPEPDGSLDPQKVIDAIGPKTKLVAVTHCSNVLGTVVDVKTICGAAREKGVATLVDGSQGAVHMPVDVQDIGCDFYPVTGHKLYGPSGSGAIYDRFKGLNWLNVQGTAPGKAAIFSLSLDGAAHAHDISTVLDKKGVAVRAGTHCAMPLMDHLGVSATARASFGLYNTKSEVDTLIEALELCHELFG
ncbi:MAG: cysteine desulfurase [Rhodobacteraceae bacterium]|nr:cysteine desulfurase [Paracoccaceae bacterium]